MTTQPALRAYVADHRCDDIESLVAAFSGEPATAPEAIDRARTFLNAARCRLINDAAIHVSSLVNQTFPRNGDAASDGNRLASPELSDILNKATVHLDSTDRLLSESEERYKDIDIDELRRRSELLRSFALVFSALGRNVETSDSHEALMEACGNLAVYVDDENRQIAESAKLWQAIAYRHMGRPDRALQVARPVLSPPASRSIGVCLRIERCLALADKGDFVAALADAARLSACVELWRKDDQNQAHRAEGQFIRTLQADLYQRWSEKLRTAGMIGAAEAAGEQAGKLRPEEGVRADTRLTETIAGVQDLSETSSKPDDHDDDEADEP